MTPYLHPNTSNESGLTICIQRRPQVAPSFDWTDFLGTSASDESVGTSSSNHNFSLDPLDENDAMDVNNENNNINNEFAGASSASQSSTAGSTAPCFASPCEKITLPQHLSCSPDSVLLNFPVQSSVDHRHCHPREPSRIKFSDKVSVRIHNVVASEHPSCKDGLALELGWNYNQAEAKLQDQGHIPLVRRSYAERRHFLLQTSGYTCTQLDGMIKR